MKESLIHLWKVFIDSSIIILDVHPSLSKYFPSHVYHTNFIDSIESTIHSITLPNWTCNDIEYTIFDFSRFTEIESIEIGNNSFGSVETFKMDGLNRLAKLKIGNNSFTKTKTGYGKNPNRSFHILNCESLESIEIGEYSFSDFAGRFELKNLPQLQSIQIGTIGSDSYNFCCNSFVIRGIDLILNIELLDLPNLQSITLGHCAFHYSLSTIIESIE